jgi:hypothetical protein
VSKSIDENIKVNTIKLTAKIALSPDSWVFSAFASSSVIPGRGGFCLYTSINGQTTGVDVTFTKVPLIQHSLDKMTAQIV